MIETVDDLVNAQDHILSVDEIEKARKADYVVVPVPEWGGNLRIASVSAEQIETLTKLSQSGNQLTAMMEALVQSFVDEHDNPSVTDPEQVKRTALILAKKEAKVIERLLRAFATLNGITSMISPLKGANSV